MGGINSGRRASTPDTDDCLRLSLSDLKRDGALKRNQLARRERFWTRYNGSETIARLSLVADIECREPMPCLRISGYAFGRALDQCIAIVTQPQPFGGERFYFLCPITGRKCTVLFIHPAKSFLASASGWGVRHASTRERDVDRAYRVKWKAESSLRALSKYARKPTRQRIFERLERAYAIIWEWEDQLMRSW